METLQRHLPFIKSDYQEVGLPGPGHQPARGGHGLLRVAVAAGGAAGEGGLRDPVPQVARSHAVLGGRGRASVAERCGPFHAEGGLPDEADMDSREGSRREGEEARGAAAGGARGEAVEGVSHVGKGILESKGISDEDLPFLGSRSHHSER